MAYHSERYPEDPYLRRRYPDESFSPWRPSLWHLWFVMPVVAAVAVVLIFYAAL
jgi:hypothetical protein